MSTSSIERQIRRFHVVVQWTSKKCTNNRDARAELLFWSLNLLFFEVVDVVVIAYAPQYDCRPAVAVDESSGSLSRVITSFTELTKNVTIPTN